MSDIIAYNYNVIFYPPAWFSWLVLWCTVLGMREPGLLQHPLFRPGNVRKPQSRCTSVVRWLFMRY